MALEQYIHGYIAKEVRFEGSDYIIKEGSLGHWAYVVLEGQVKMKKTTPMGLVTIDTLGEGDVFGEISLWDPGKGTRAESIVADGPVRLGILDNDLLLKDYETLSPRLKSLLGFLMERLLATTKKAVTLAQL